MPVSTFLKALKHYLKSHPKWFWPALLGSLALALWLGLLEVWFLFLLLSAFLSNAYYTYKLSSALSSKSSDLPEVDWGPFSQIFEKLFQYKRQTERRWEFLRGYHAVLLLTLNHLQGAVVLIRKDGAIEWCNKQAETLFDINSKRDRGQNLFHLIRSPLVKALYDQQQNEESLTFPLSSNRFFSARFHFIPDEPYNIALFTEANELMQLKRLFRQLLRHLSVLEAEPGQPHLKTDLMLLSQVTPSTRAEPVAQETFESLLKESFNTSPHLQHALSVAEASVPSLEVRWFRSFFLLLIQSIEELAEEGSEVQWFFGPFFADTQLKITFKTKKDLPLHPGLSAQPLLDYLCIPLDIEQEFFRYRDSETLRLRYVFKKKLTTKLTEPDLSETDLTENAGLLKSEESPTGDTSHDPVY